MATDEDRELWLFLLGGAYALFRAEDGSHRFTREELLGMVDVSHAPADIASMYDALEAQDFKTVRKWLSERNVEMGDGKSVFRAMADRVRQSHFQRFLEQKMSELGYAARLKSKPLELAEFLDTMASQIREALQPKKEER